MPFVSDCQYIDLWFDDDDADDNGDGDDEGDHDAVMQLHGVFNAAAFLIVCKQKVDNVSSTIRDVLRWLPIQQRMQYVSCLATCWPCANQCPRISAICSASHGELAVPATRMAHYTPCSLLWLDRLHGTLC